MQRELVSLPFCYFCPPDFHGRSATAIAATVAANRCRVQGQNDRSFLVAGFLASWLAIAILIGDGTNFPIPPQSRRPISGLVALIPFAIEVIALFASKNLRAINTATPSAWLIAIQTYRFAGIMFLFPFVTNGILPACFGYPAGIGDAVTGILAPIVALMVERDRSNAVK